jgi:uncharacterized tellurite resistance protein B-like protein
MLVDAIRALFSRPAPDTDAAGARAGASAPAGAPAPDPVQLAACALLLDVAHADGEFTADERAHLEAALARHFGLATGDVPRLIELAEAERGRSVDHFSFTATLKREYGDAEKRRLAEVMWGLVLADGAVAEHEHYLTRKIANLLDLAPVDLSAAKAAAERAIAGRG